MFGMSMAEIAVILVLALVILGPEKLPDLARTLGKTIREIRRAGNQIRDAIMFEDEMRDFRNNNRSIARTNTSPSAGYIAKEYGDDDMMDGPFDQLDDEEWGGGGGFGVDPLGPLESLQHEAARFGDEGGRPWRAVDQSIDGSNQD